MIYLKHLFSDFKHVMILCVAMAYLMVIDTLLFITRMWAMSDLGDKLIMKLSNETMRIMGPVFVVLAE